MTQHDTGRVHDAIIVGAGYAGLGQGAQLVRDGIGDFLILERADDLGGVWRDNDYPGAACDTQSVIYCYSHHLHLDVSRMYAGRDELLGYLNSLADAYDLRRHIVTGQDVTAAGWDEADGVWVISTRGGQTYRTRTFIPAWGQLGVPNIPALPGADTFRGESFHSSQWRHDIDLTGLRVASVGAAATAVQYVPEVAQVASSLTVFQRSANYILPRNQIVFSADESAGFREDPGRYRDLRQSIHDEREAGFERTRRGTGAAADGVRLAREHMESVISDPVLREKFTPDYDYGCKRILRSDDFYPTFNRGNVALVTEGIERITPAGIVTADGEEHEVDVIIYGTGFRSQAFQGDMVITGRNSVDLAERWGAAPEAYLGMAVDGFPNMFMLYGPNTNLNHHSIVAMLEAQNAYVSQAVDHLRSTDTVSLEVREEELRKFNDHVQDELSRSAYSADCNSWYKNADGRVINNWSGTVAEYHDLTRAFRPGDYVGAGHPAER
jgi:cation diffusion facilitator CzcD-associated flavoprotein CzcO